MSSVFHSWWFCTVWTDCRQRIHSSIILLKYENKWIIADLRKTIKHKKDEAVVSREFESCHRTSSLTRPEVMKMFIC